MEKYKELTVVRLHRTANRTSEVLESAGIPVMVEHVEVASGGSSQTGFRVLVPDQYSQSALRLINAFVE